MTPTHIGFTTADGSTVVVPLGQSPGGGYDATVGDYHVYVSVVRTAVSPAKARWA